MRVTAWNIEGRLSRFADRGERGSPEQIIHGIEAAKSDIIFLPESFDGDKKIEPAIEQRLQQLYGQSVTVAYSEQSDRYLQAVVDPHMMLMTNYEIVDHTELRLANIRSMLVTDIRVPYMGVVRLFGVHIDDRNEANRLQQVEELLPHINDSPHPVVVLGDFNAMYRDSLPAGVLRSRLATTAIDLLPSRHFRDVLGRLSQMAIGETMQKFEVGTNLRDVDDKKRPTTTPKMRDQEWLPSIRLAQIDHILVSPDFQATDFAIAPDGGSDHRAISVTLEPTRQKR